MQRITTPRAQIGNLRRRTPATRRLAVLTAAVAMLGAACDDDDDDTADISPAACDAYAGLQAAFFGDPAALGPAADAFAAVAPEDLADSVDVLRTAMASDDPAATETPEYAAAQTEVANTVFTGCAAETSVDVTGVDYEFDGLPNEVAAGRTALRLTNDSAADEPHELIIATGANGESAADLMAMPLEELFGAVRPVGLAFTTSPGDTATTLVDLEPGEYIVICTLPVGGFDAAQDGPGDPHSNHGMVAALTVA